MQRRRLLRAALAAPVLAAILPRAPVARAQTFDRTIRVVVPNPPGGTSDILARLIAPELGRALGPSVIVENKPGAGGNIGADAVAKSRPDGATMLLLDVTTLATNPALYPRLPFDARRDLAPVTMLIYAPYILVASNAGPVRDAGSLAAYARANPGTLNAGTSGSGTASHLALIGLAEGWGTRMTHVPYRGGAPALTAVAGGEVDLTITGATQAQLFAVRGQMRPIAVTGPRRLAALPDVPTFRELGWPGADAGTWQALLVQGGTPRATVERIAREARAALAQPAVTERLAGLGAEPRADGPDALREWLDRETEAYTRLIRANNITLE